MRRRKSKAGRPTFIALLLLAWAGSPATEESMRATISVIEQDRIILPDGREFWLINEHAEPSRRLRHPHATEYYTDTGRRISFETLYGVGHVDEALITLDGRVVRNIRVIELQQ
jgi:hypothetical protein